MVIYKSTLKRFLSRKFILIYFTVFILIFLGFTAIFRQAILGDYANNFIIVRDEYLASFFVATFLWTLGVPFQIIIVSKCVALIQQEVDENTLVLLIAKPIERKRIFLEKYLGTYTVSSIIGLVSVLLSLSLYIIFYKIDSVILEMFITLLPSLVIYTLLINLIISALTIFVTSIFKHRNRAIITLIVFIMIVELIFPLIKPMLGVDLYKKYYIYLYDINYHFGIMFYEIINLFSNIQFSPLAQQNIGQFVGIFATMGNDYLDHDLRFVPDSFATNNFIPPLVIFFFWIFISFLFLFLSYLILKKQDID